MFYKFALDCAEQIFSLFRFSIETSSLGLFFHVFYIIIFGCNGLLSYLCSIFIQPKTLYGVGRVRLMDIKRRNCTLWFWCSKNLAVLRQIIKNKATGTPLGMFIYIHHQVGRENCILTLLWLLHVIIHSTWGFRRCSFRWFGRCQSLYCVERATDSGSTFFLCLYVMNIIMSLCVESA